MFSVGKQNITQVPKYNYILYISENQTGLTNVNIIYLLLYVRNCKLFQIYIMKTTCILHLYVISHITDNLVVLERISCKNLSTLYLQ